jgi:hypothetical protein
MSEEALLRKKNNARDANRTTEKRKTKARWNEVGKDAIWWSTAMNREEWRQLLSESKTLTELWNQ